VIDGSTLSGDRGVAIDTKATTEAEVKARVSANLFAEGHDINRDQTAFAAAIAVDDLQSTTTVSPTSTVMSAHGNVDINSDGDVTNKPWAQPMIFSDGIAGISLGLTIDKSTVHTEVDGHVSAGGAGTFAPAQVVNLQNNTFTIPNNGFTDVAASMAAAVGIGLYTNSAQAIVHGGARLDAHDTVKVESALTYPFLVSSPTASINPVEFLKNQGPEGWAFFMDGTLGFSDDFFNTWVLTDADGSKVGAGASVAVTIYNNTSNAIIESGAQINQDTDPTFRTGPQTVEVHAGTSMQLLEVAGIASLNLNPGGAFDAIKTKGLSERLGKLISPIGGSGEKGGIGASFLFDAITNNTLAEVQDGVGIHTGVPMEPSNPEEEAGLKIEAAQTTFSFAPAQSGAKVSEFALGGSFVGGLLSDTTHAHLGSGVDVTGGPVRVEAGDWLLRRSRPAAEPPGDRRGLHPGLDADDRPRHAHRGRHQRGPGVGPAHHRHHRRRRRRLEAGRCLGDDLRQRHQGPDRGLPRRLDGHRRRGRRRHARRPR
jgi:hypothetical protein